MEKRSILFKLPYWEEFPVRHNIDVMHVEKNVAASIVSTLLHCGKSKYGLNARRDLEDLGIRKELHPKLRGKRTSYPQQFGLYPRQRRRFFVGDFLISKAQTGTAPIYPEASH